MAYAGEADAYIWLPLGIWGASGACHYELDVVWEDHKRVEEDFSKEAMT